MNIEELPYEELISKYRSASELNKKYVKEIERLNNIIKEVREYIGSTEHFEDDFDTEIEKVYKILDEGE